MTLRLVFHLPLRQMEGFLRSILKLMGLDLPCPDHTTVSRRNRTVDLRNHIDRLPKGPVCFILDSTGLMICGQGEWHSKKHREKWRKRWKNLHVGVDGEGWMLASTVTDGRDPDPSQEPGLLSQLGRQIDRLVEDGVYDQESVYEVLEQHSPGVSVIIPPRKEAGLSRKATTSPTQRDVHIAEIQSKGRFKWKRESVYYRQNYAENAFFLVILILTKPLGSYMAKVFEGKRTFLHAMLRPVERGIYRLCGIREEEEQRWTGYAGALLLFSLTSLLLTYFIQPLQGHLPINPQGFGTAHPPAGATVMTSDLAFNTAVSFKANTN